MGDVINLEENLTDLITAFGFKGTGKIFILQTFGHIHNDFNFFVYENTKKKKHKKHGHNKTRHAHKNALSFTLINGIFDGCCRRQDRDAANDLSLVAMAVKAPISI